MTHIYNYIKVSLLALVLLPVAALAQKQSDADSTMNALRISNLKSQITAIDKQIKTEDAKRNKTILGVSPENLEAMNDRQDSVCLALRSQRTDMELELKELTYKQTAAAIAQQLTVLQQHEANNGHASNGVQPGKPQKPAKPQKPGKRNAPDKVQIPSKKK